MPLNLRALTFSFLLLAGGAAEAEPLVVAREDCARLVQHIPGAGTEFVPGRAAGGREVAPAELPDESWWPPEATFTFDIEVRPLDEREFDETSLFLGRVQVTREGTATIDGVPLRPEPEAALAGLCRNALGR